MAIWSAIAHEGATAQMMLGNGFGLNWKGLYVTSLLDAHSAWRQRADELSDTLKITMLAGYYVMRKYRGHYYAKAQNLARKLTAAYDTALARFDALLLPTTPIKATRLPAPDAPRAEVLARGFEMITNCAPFDVSGHPALTMPCGVSDGLPAGLMLVGRQFDEMTLYRLASAWESGADGKSIRP
jgi:amidase